MSAIPPLLEGKQTLGELPENDAHDPSLPNRNVRSDGEFLLTWRFCRNLTNAEYAATIPSDITSTSGFEWGAPSLLSKEISSMELWWVHATARRGPEPA